MSRKYRCLGDKQEFTNGSFTIVPIRNEDRYYIMRWRNEQIYHLRQMEHLTEEMQDRYFEQVVARLFEEDHPKQLLFSFLKDGECIGYGGLVHINWIDRNAEISFIMDTKLEAKEFRNIWERYLDLIEQVAFMELSFHKLYVYAFDLRPHLYKALEAKAYFLDARLKEHCLFRGKFIDVVIHSKLSLLK